MSSSAAASAISPKNVRARKAVCDEVKKEMWKILTSLEERLMWKSEDYAEGGSGDDEYLDDGEKTRRFKKRRVSAESSLSKKDLKEKASEVIASFFYNNAIPFDAAKSDELREMFELVAQHGVGFEPPSYREINIKGKYLKRNVDLTKEAIEEHKAYWKKTGCSVVINEWRKGKKTILNFMVNSPKGTVFFYHIEVSPMYWTTEIICELMDHFIDDIGEENVIQVITNYAPIYKAAGEMLMEKRKRLYWTPCAAHCIGLMLEDFEKIPFHKETIANGKTIITYIYLRTNIVSLVRQFNGGKGLGRPAETRFGRSYLILGFLYDNKGALIRMFRSSEWKSSKYAKTKDGKFVQNVVMDKGFWKNVVICLKGACPLIKVLSLVDSTEKQAMEFIYEEMDRAKEMIQGVFNGVKGSYMPLWDIIDERWNTQLYRPLHATGYYLNPRLHYSTEFKSDYKVKHGLHDCLLRIVGDVEEAAKIHVQLDDFKSQSKSFGCVAAKSGVNTKTPSQWWDSFGNEHPELQKFAISVLSLTCSSPRCEHMRTAFEKVHSEKRNLSEQIAMHDVLFLMINSKLAKEKEARKANEDNIDDLSSDDDWIMDDDRNSENLDWDSDIPNEVGEDASGDDGASVGDLEIANFDGDECDVDHLEDDD